MLVERAYRREAGRRFLDQGVVSREAYPTGGVCRPWIEARGHRSPEEGCCRAGQRQRHRDLLWLLSHVRVPESRAGVSNAKRNGFHAGSRARDPHQHVYGLVREELSVRAWQCRRRTVISFHHPLLGWGFRFRIIASILDVTRIGHSSGHPKSRQDPAQQNDVRCNYRQNPKVRHRYPLT